MLCNLLAERFKLEFHREMREQPALVLTVARNGHKLQPANDTATKTTAGIKTLDGKFTIAINGVKGASAADIKYAPPGRVLTLTARGASMGDLIVSPLRLFSGAPIVNETRLEALYDFQLTWNLGDPLTDPLQRRLGLKLESRSVPFSFFIVDSAEKPSAN